MYRRVICVLLAAFFLSSVIAQPVADKTGIAPFSITQLNGVQYTYKQLKKNIATVLIYFSPTCDHCKEFTKELLQHKNDLGNKQFVMVTYGPVNEMKPFDSLYHITAMPNFKMGTEKYTFIVQQYYGVQRFPYIVMYNKQMKKVKTIPVVTNPEEAAEEIANLK